MKIFRIVPDKRVSVLEKDQEGMLVYLGIGYCALENETELFQNGEALLPVDWENDPAVRKDILARMEEMSHPDNMYEEERRIYGILLEVDGQKNKSALHRAINSETAWRIQSYASLGTQINLVAAASEGRLSKEERRTFSAYQDWITQTRETGQRLIEAKAEDFFNDEKWSPPPGDVQRLLARF